MGTKVRLTRSGGFGGLSMVADIDLDQLPEPTARKARAALAEVEFGSRAAPARAARHPGAADMYQYDLVVDSDAKRSLTAHEPLSDPGLQALVDVLLPLATPE